MELKLLGAVEARDGAVPLPLGGPKQRALLAILLLHANEPVSRDRLVDGLWGEQPPPSASHTLDDYVSRLRKALGPGRIERRPPGYALSAEDDEVDLFRFRRLVEEGRDRLAGGDAEAAAAQLRGALELWRGPALADLLFEPFASSEAERLEEERLVALEDRIDADLALGRHRELVGELEGLVREHPLRERLVDRLMLALYRSGRQAAALDAFRSARARLAEELGLEPSPQLRERERRILAHDPGLAAPKRERPRRPALPARRRVVAGVGAAAVVAAAVAGAIVLGTGRRSASHAPAAGAPELVALAGGSDRSVSAATALPDAPQAMVVDGASVWLADPDSDAILRVDGASRAVVDRVPLAAAPAAVAVAGGDVWVTTVEGSRLIRIDPETDTVVQAVDLGGASAAALAAGAGGLWVADPSDGALIEFDPSTGVARRTFTLALRPTALAVGSGAIWAADYDSATVAEVDPHSGQTLATVHVGNGPTAVATGDGGVWVANGLDATVSRIDPATASVEATIAVGSGPTSLAVTPRAVWVADEYARTLTRIDPRRDAPVAVEALPGGPTALAAAGRRILVATRPLGRHRGGTLRLVSSQSLPLDPALDFFIGPFQLAALTGDSLVTFEHTGGPDGQRLVPDLAVSLPTPGDGGRSFVFRLRRGIRYSNGRSLEPSDFRRAFERLFRLRSGASGFFAGVVGARSCLLPHATTCDLSRGVVADDRAGTVEFHLVAPDPDFLFKLTIGGFSMPVPPGTPMRPVGFRPIPGTGPYEVAAADARGIRLVRNPYFREWSHAAQPDGNPDTIVWRFGLAVPQEVRSIERGQADWTFDQIPASLLAAVRARYPAQVHGTGSVETDFFQFNTTLPPFDDVRVRRALNFALDRSLVVRLYGGPAAAAPTCQVLPPALPGYRRYCPYTRGPGASGAWRAPDLVRAERLVAASGTRGDAVTVWGWTDDPTITPAVTRYAARVLARLGYRVRVRLVPHAAFDRLPASVRRSIQVIPAGWIADYPSAYDFVDLWLSCGGAYDHGWFCDPRVDRAMRRADSLEASDPSAAAAMWARVDRRLVDEAAWAPLANPRPPDFVSARVGGYEHNPVEGIVADQLWLRRAGRGG